MTHYKTSSHHPRLGVEIYSDKDLKALTVNQQAEFRNTLWQHGVTIARNQHLNAAELEEFASNTLDR